MRRAGRRADLRDEQRCDEEAQAALVQFVAVSTREADAA